jgi:hypothetical protein
MGKHLHRFTHRETSKEEWVKKMPTPWGRQNKMLELFRLIHGAFVRLSDEIKRLKNDRKVPALYTGTLDKSSWESVCRETLISCKYNTLEDIQQMAILYSFID